MQLFTIISLLIAISGAAYAVIAAIKEYTDVYIENCTKIAKTHLQNTNPSKSANKELYSQARSNYRWGNKFKFFYKVCFFAPLIIFCYLVARITFVVYKEGGPATEIITETTWPYYKKVIFWVPVSYSVAVVLGGACLGIMAFYFWLLKKNAKISPDYKGEQGSVEKI